MADSPFLQLLQALPEARPTYLWTSLTFLYAQHRGLQEFHESYLIRRRQPGYEEPFFESVFVKNKYVLDYTVFINCLNQFARALKVFDANLQIPSGWSVRFFRNVVVEHWDEYALPSTSGTFAKIYVGPRGYPLVNIAAEQLDEQRKVLRSRIDQILASFGHRLSVTGYADDAWTSAEAVAELYTTLEACFPQPDTRGKKNKSLKDLAELLFRFGLPGPIVDIDAYSTQLYQHLHTHSIFHA